MHQKSNSTMKEIRKIYEQKYKQLFVLESGQVIKAYKKDVYIDENGIAHLKQQVINNVEHEERELL